MVWKFGEDCEKMSTRLLMCGFSHHTEPFFTEAENGLNAYLFRWQTEGQARALVDGKMQIVEAGDLLLYQPGDPYRLMIGKDKSTRENQPIASSDYFLSCQGSWVKQWWNRRKRPTLVRIGIEDRLLSLWRMLISEKRRMEKANEEICDYLLRSLCLTIDHMIDERFSPQGPPFVANRIKSYIEERAATRIRIKDLAEHVRLSESRTSHLFKTYFGKTIIEYVHEVRLSIAEERIKYSTLSLEQIAESCGFGSYSYFYRIFRKKYGQSPAAYREAYFRSLAGKPRSGSQPHSELQAGP